MADEQIVAPPLPEPIQAPAQDTQDNMTGYLVKMVTSAVLGPKISPYLVAAGIPLDPLMMTAIIAGVMHKAHGILREHFGLTWL